MQYLISVATTSKCIVALEIRIPLGKTLYPGKVNQHGLGSDMELSYEFDSYGNGRWPAE